MFMDIKRDISEYFDSALAGPPPPTCMNILNLCSNIIFNDIKLQDDTFVCGQFCIVYLLLRCRGYSYKEVVEILQSIPENDRAVYDIIQPYFPSLLFKL